MRTLFERIKDNSLAIGLYVLLSVFLRQEGSPESKPVESHDDETGEANK